MTPGGEPLSDLVNWLEEVVFRGSLNFGSPTFLAHPDCGVSTAGVLGDIANAFLGQNLASIDYSPVATALEARLLRELREVVGYPLVAGAGTQALGGGIVFGGSQANLAGLLGAREHLRARLRAAGRPYDPRRTRVLANRPFTHFSLRRSLHLLGLGNRDLDDAALAAAGLEREALLDVTTRDYRTDPADLERRLAMALDRGEDVMAVFAVAGDSRYMAFDDLDAVCDVAERYGVWVHVDACEGGQVLFSPRRRHLMSGVDRANSVSLDPHKVLMVPYNVSAFFLRDPAWLGYFASDPTSLINQDDDSLGAYTPGINSKSFVSLKLILMLRHWGWDRVAAEIDRRHSLALAAARLVREQPRLALVNPLVEHNAVGFLYLPYREVSREELFDLNRRLHGELNSTTRYFVHGFAAKDDMGVVYRDRSELYVLRMMFGNPLTRLRDVEGALLAVVAAGDALVSRAAAS